MKASECFDVVAFIRRRQLYTWCSESSRLEGGDLVIGLYCDCVRSYLLSCASSIMCFWLSRVLNEDCQVVNGLEFSEPSRETVLPRGHFGS